MTLETVSFETEAKVVSLFECDKTGWLWRTESYQVLGMYLIFIFEARMGGEALKITSNLLVNVPGSIYQGRYREVRSFLLTVSEKLSEPVVVIR